MASLAVAQGDCQMARRSKEVDAVMTAQTKTPTAPAIKPPTIVRVLPGDHYTTNVRQDHESQGSGFYGRVASAAGFVISFEGTSVFVSDQDLVAATSRRED